MTDPDLVCYYCGPWMFWVQGTGGLACSYRATVHSKIFPYNGCGATVGPGTLQQMTRALVEAIQNPSRGGRIVDLIRIRRPS
jgi:hypothetical protein